MEFEPLEGSPVRLPPPGRVKVKLSPGLWLPYRQLYDRFNTVTSGLPVLRERDFDGRAVAISRAQLDALNAALANAFAGEARPSEGPASVFEAQADGRSKLFKRLQYLS